MESIAQFINSLKHLETQIYHVNTQLEPLVLRDEIKPEFQALLDKSGLEDLIRLSENCLRELSERLEPITLMVNTMMKRRSKSTITPYASFKVDEPPIVGPRVRQLSFEDILGQSEEPVKPVRRSKPLDYEGVCLKCGAPNAYIQKHTHVQYICRVCTHTFTLKHTYHDEITHRCPHCTYKLMLHHERRHYDVLQCHNDRCPYYIKRLEEVRQGKTEHLRTHTDRFKLRYTFRLFDFDLSSIKANIPFSISSRIDLSKIHHSQHTLGLILTYYVNYGLSSRKTSRIMREIHDIDISHQTVVNYAEAVAAIIEALNASHPYDLSDNITFDETYIKVSGTSKYVFFGSDTTRKIITSYKIFDHRDTRNAVSALYQTFMKYPMLPNPFNVITDGNPIYNAAQIFFHLNDINFDLHQVIGIKNNDPVSLKWRPFKQAEERLNRTYKQNYYGTNGYGSLRNANVFMSLFVAFHNFLREHSSLDHKPPVHLDCLDETRIMPFKWIKLIEHTHRMFEDESYVS
jgi:putative transposase